jgi:2-polyprenyl-6-hydroxyphenyl methylase/3-demethylubiquinone-9 3-methyltransferase
MRLRHEKSGSADRAELTAPCKCCGADTYSFANIDANRSCADSNGRVFPLSSRTISYLRCRRCGFIFTPDFDACSDKEISEQIYNSEYIIADPEFRTVRPKTMSEVMIKEIGMLKSSISALDYGGGNGTFAGLMSQAGFFYQCCDPYFGMSVEPAHQFDLVTAFEVMEHTLDPKVTLKTMLSYLKPDGLIWLSTALQPRNVKPSWWYIGPRNGHFSIFSEQSLIELASRCGVHYFQKSEIANYILNADRRETILYLSSRRGFASLLNTARQIKQVRTSGRSGMRHWMRAIAWEAFQRTGVFPSRD